MSGLEVIGLVVGILPLAVQAVKGYRTTLSGVANVDRDLNALIRDLETEHVRLRTTCEVLFDGVAPLSIIDKLIETPFGPDWKPYKEKLRLRLWTESGQFEEQVAEMQKAAEDLKAKLAIDEDGKTKLTDRIAIIRELKRRTSFTLKKKDYDEVLTRIKTANSVLHELTGKTCGLEPNRRRRSQARLNNLIRTLARSIFNALYRATTCHCANLHTVCLELVPRNVVIVPSDQDDQVAKDFNFHVVMGPKEQSSGEGDTEATSSVAKLQKAASNYWKSLLIRLAESGSVPAPAPTPSSTVQVTSVAQGVSRTSKWLTSLSFRPARETSTSPTQTLVEVSQSFIMPPSQPSASEPPALSNLCQAVFKGHKEPVVDYYGYITDIERKFGLYSGQDESEICKTVTLRQVLNGKEPDLPRFDYPEKLRVALTVCASILHLHSTPWLGRTLTLDDVVFLREDGPSPPNAGSLYRPYLIKILRESESSASASQGCKALNTPRPLNLTMLSLGAMLIQVIIGRTDHELDITATDMPSILSKKQAGNRLGDQILESGGINYADAVKWCLQSLFGTAGLDNDTFCQNFYVEVVARLEEDVALLSND
ncbi:hypothetical protein B0J13DRAFT_628981 [Dactylonectria estremocensis]|uniref:DUF7580 domain-containing protein n=1 Tax=Dactylonectria estremocensis TaxID=1079267 RepID=A0A9P9DMH4_9HYPO|nr:hypothetical protein B0J13DRAFT_628981 [Dactylonectria estremocensis]